MRALLAVCLALLAAAATARADEVRFPLTVDYDVLRIALRKHLDDEGRRGLEIWRSADGCSSFVLRDATVEPSEGRLKIAGPASASGGIPLFGLCWANVTWTGHADIVAQPVIGNDWQLRLQDLDARLSDSSGQTRSIADRVLSAARSWVTAELSTFSYDVGPPIGELTMLLGGFAGSSTATPLATALQTLRPAGVAVDRDAVQIVLAIDVPSRPAARRAPEPALTPAEVRKWEARLDDVDGFVSFVVKGLAGDNPDPAVRAELLGVMLDARRQVVDMLARGPEPGADGVRQVFVGTWDGLRAIVRRTAAQEKSDVPRAFRYVVFLAAGDALAAIDAAAPAAGLDFSADGLRRLARALEPQFSGDPLQRPELVDPRLQHLFRFRDPDAPPRRPRRKPQLPASSWLWFGPRVASAEPADEWRELAQRLDRWVPSWDELPAYRATIDRLLVVAAERSLDPDALDERFDTLYGHLIKATAWQESCWRQFVSDAGGRVTYLHSRTGDVGLMQINVRIWRGFFNPNKLRWNAAYNAGAGAEILEHLLIRYGTRESRHGIENAARATYSAYQGGPARYRRYRSATPASEGGAIDRAFWEKYRAVAAGTAEDHVLCLRARPTS